MSVTVRRVGGGWLRRELELSTPEKAYRVVYDGRGLGFETVYVDGELAWRGTGNAWFYPRFFFYVGDLPASLDVRVWPWLGVRAVTLRVRGEVVYREGPPAGSDWHP